MEVPSAMIAIYDVFYFEFLKPKKFNMIENIVKLPLKFRFQFKQEPSLSFAIPFLYVVNSALDLLFLKQIARDYRISICKLFNRRCL